MNDAELKNLVDLVGGALGVSATQALRREDCASWDSLNHLKLMMLVEDEFGVAFTPEDMAGATSVSAIAELVSSKR